MRLTLVAHRWRSGVAWAVSERPFAFSLLGPSLIACANCCGSVYISLQICVRRSYGVVQANACLAALRNPLVRGAPQSGVDRHGPVSNIVEIPPSTRSISL
jgi:hypothetical protein